MNTDCGDQVFHIRKRLGRRGGSQSYRDKSVRQVETMCGASVTEYDVANKQKPQPWTDEYGRKHEPCSRCTYLWFQTRS